MKSSARTSSGAKSLTRARRAGWDEPTCQRSGLGQRRRRTPTRSHSCRSSARRCASSSNSRRRKSPAAATNGSLTSARTWSGMCAFPRAGPPGRPSPSATPRCSIPTAPSTPTISAPRLPPTHLSSGATGPRNLRAALHLSRLPLRRGRRLPRHARRRTISAASWSAPTRRRPALAMFRSNLNRLFENIVWGQRGNFLSVPTDCPQRDERMGWMGDAQVFAPTAARNADVAGFFAKWLVDISDGQGATANSPHFVPRANQNNSYPVWGDAGVIIPWTMYSPMVTRRFSRTTTPT